MQILSTDQVLIHGIGDYITQSDWMAQNKTKAHWPAFCHALVYSSGFLLLQPSWKAWTVIFATHFLIDRYRLARYIVWAKNFLAPKTYWKQLRSGEWFPVSNQFNAEWRIWIDLAPGPMPAEFKDVLTVGEYRMLPFRECAGTGYPPSTPAWLSVWLLIIADNILHIAINGVALRWM